MAQLSLGLERAPAPLPATEVPEGAVQVLADLLMEALGIGSDTSRREDGDDAQDQR
jgi:hypothetical protein